MHGAIRYRPNIDLSNVNNAHTQLILGTGNDKRVLEVGPASGYITEALRDRGCAVTCIESDEEAAQVARSFAERMIVGDFEQIDLASELGDARFEVIMFGDVLEHLLDPTEALRRVRPFIAGGGFVISSIPNVAHASVRLALLSGVFRYTEWGLLDRTHIRFFTPTTARTMFEDAGYTVESMERITVDPFATELEVQEADFPPELNARIREDEEAMTYQFVFRAVPEEGGSPKETAESSSSLTVEALWELHRRAIELYEVIEQKDANISDFQRMVAEKDQAITELQKAVAERDEEIARTRRLSVYTVPDTVSRVRRALGSGREKK